MKKQINILIFFLFIIPVANGQVRFGPRVGYNVSSFNPDYYTDFNNYRKTIDFGLYAKISIVKKLNLQTELMYSSKGLHETDYNNSTETMTWTDIRNRYIDVPILASVGNDFCLLVGIVPSFLIKSETEVSISNYSLNIKDKEITDTKEEFKSFDFGLCLGFEHEFKFGLNYGARVNYGLLNFDETDTMVNKNFSILLSVGYSFGSK